MNPDTPGKIFIQTAINRGVWKKSQPSGISASSSHTENSQLQDSQQEKAVLLWPLHFRDGNFCMSIWKLKPSKRSHSTKEFTIHKGELEEVTSTFNLLHHMLQFLILLTLSLLSLLGFTAAISPWMGELALTTCFKVWTFWISTFAANSFCILRTSDSWTRRPQTQRKAWPEATKAVENKLQTRIRQGFELPFTLLTLTIYPEKKAPKTDSRS